MAKDTRPKIVRLPDLAEGYTMNRVQTGDEVYDEAGNLIDDIDTTTPPIHVPPRRAASD